MQDFKIIAIFSAVYIAVVMGLFICYISSSNMIIGRKQKKRKEHPSSSIPEPEKRNVSLWVRIPLIILISFIGSAVLAIHRINEWHGSIFWSMVFLLLAYEVMTMKTRKPHPGRIIHFIGLSSLAAFIFIISFLILLLSEINAEKQAAAIVCLISICLEAIIWGWYYLGKKLQSKRAKRNIPPPPFLNGQTVFVETQLPPPKKFKFSELPDRDKYFCMTLLFDLLLLFLAACDLRLPYGFYTILRIVTCVTGVWFIVLLKSPVFRFLLGLVALLYNPLITIELDDRDAWQLFNILVIVLYIVAAIVLWRNRCRAAQDGQESA